MGKIRDKKIIKEVLLEVRDDLAKVKMRYEVPIHWSGPFLCNVIDEICIIQERYSLSIAHKVRDYLESKKPSNKQYKDFIENISWIATKEDSTAWWGVKEYDERLRFLNILIAELK